MCVKELKLDVNDVVNCKYKQLKFEELHSCLWIDLGKSMSCICWDYSRISEVMNLIFHNLIVLFLLSAFL